MIEVAPFRWVHPSSRSRSCYVVRLLIDRAADVADQGSGHDRSLTDSPPFLRFNAYHLCETPLVAVGAC